jgi:photosystem II stability/assembly factor-like uncharacterized protein
MKKSDTIILFVLVASLFAALFIGTVQAASWNKISSPTDATFESVKIISSNNGWIVGSDGVIIRWDGTTWNLVTSPTSYTLKSVDFISSTEAWAVNFGVAYASDHSIIRWDGANWNNVTIEG